MTTYMSTAVSAKADGIAVAVIDPNAFKGPVENAMNAGIPVLSYNADGSFANGQAVIGSNRLAYVGQALYISGQQMGEKILSLVPGGGDIAIFIATPGSGNIQPRYDGAAAVLKAKGGYNIAEVATGALTGQEQSAIKAYLLGHKSIKGAFAVDGGSTEFLGTQLKAAGLTIPNGGFDTTGSSLPNIKAGLTDFVIYQDPYLQGFLPVHLHVPVQPVRRHDRPARHRHRPVLHREGQPGQLPGVQPVPGPDHGAEVHQAPGRGHPERAGHHQHLRHDADGRMALPATGEGLPAVPSGCKTESSGGLASPSRVPSALAGIA